MRPRTEFPEALRGLAQHQGGVFNTAQAHGFGLNDGVLRRMRADRLLHSPAKGLYFVGDDTWLGRAWGGVLLGGSSSVIGGEAAGHLWGLNDAPVIIDVWTTDQTRSRGCWVFHRGERRGRGEPPRLSLEQTVLELSARADTSDEVTALVNKALAQRRTTAKRLELAALEALNLRNRSEMLGALEAYGVGAQSALEKRYLDVERRHGLPRAKRQRSVSSRTRSDVVYEEQRVIVELDGQMGHVGEGRFRDMHRDNLHVIDGWITLRFGWYDVMSRPCEVAAMVAAVLRSRGWRSEMSRCKACALVA